MRFLFNLIDFYHYTSRRSFLANIFNRYNALKLLTNAAKKNRIWIPNKKTSTVRALFKRAESWL